MFCLGEESLANHLNERKPRESIEELEQRLKQEQEAEDLKLEQLSRQASVSSSGTNPTSDIDTEKITVVQVGEVKREWKKDYEPAGSKQQQADGKDKQKGNESNNQKQKKEDKDKKSLKKQESGADYAAVYNTGAITRGKHQKIRKMKEKYADQDEEER